MSLNIDYTIESPKPVFNIYSQPTLFSSPLKEINPRDRL
jgi:hypothetical protein